jgi:L-ribulose-5-phosphate 3-epimerase
VLAGGIRNRGEGGAAGEGIESEGRRTGSVLGLDNLEIGLMFWADENAPRETLGKVKAFGLRCGQLGIPGGLPIEGAAEKWDSALTAEHFTLGTVFCSFEGEDYADIPTVTRTVGLAPAATRRERLARIKEVSRFTRDLGIDSLALHIGVVPPGAGGELIDVTREVCDVCKENGQRFALETGQEPAKVFLGFIEEVDRSNLMINFDPANMILYGTGDPVEALDVLGKRVISVHCKDGDWPVREHPESLGEERALGKGSVDFPAFIAKLKNIGYTGPLFIERESSPGEQRNVEIREGIALLKRLTP